MLHACYMRTSACYTSSKHTPTAHTPTVRTEQRGQLGDESGLDHLASEAGVEGEVEEETKGGALELLVLAGNKPGQLLHGAGVRLATHTHINTSTYKLTCMGRSDGRGVRESGYYSEGCRFDSSRAK